MDFAKPFKAIYLPQDVPSTSDRRLIELKNQVQRLMEAHLAPKSSVQVNKIASSCEICSSPHNTQYCMENPEQAFVDYASSHSNEVGETNAAKENDHSITIGTKEEFEEESEESDDETEEEEEDDPEYFDTFPTVEELSYYKWLLKNPPPPWVNAKVFVGNFTYEYDFVVLEEED
ncbi:hypothetical protein Tco_1013524 [Tanacetum coccineum]